MLCPTILGQRATCWITYWVYKERLTILCIHSLNFSEHFPLFLNLINAECIDLCSRLATAPTLFLTPILMTVELIFQREDYNLCQRQAKIFLLYMMVLYIVPFEYWLYFTFSTEAFNTFNLKAQNKRGLTFYTAFLPEVLVSCYNFVRIAENDICECDMNEITLLPSDSQALLLE